MPDIRLVTKKISIPELKEIAEERFGDMVKAVVDLKKGVMAIGAEMHVDEEALLLESGSKQSDLWGINLYHEMPFPEMVEFDSMVNIRPRQNNRSRGVDSEETRNQILAAVKNLLEM